MQPRLSWLILFLAASSAAAQEAGPNRPPAADAFLAQATALAPELVKAVAQARMHNKNVLVLFPAAGQDLAGLLKKDRVLSRPLLYEVEIVSVVGEQADRAANCWGVGEQRPAAVMLGNRGAVLTRLSAAALLTDDKPAGAELLKQLEPEFCKPVDAENKLADALVEAKKTGRSVFVRFDAPW